ncbi:MAG: M1 family metallopeptidase, partial [Planctomycetota bacterium JB042]
MPARARRSPLLRPLFGLASSFAVAACASAAIAAEEASFSLVRADVRLAVDVDSRRVAGEATLLIEARERLSAVVVSLNDLLAVTAVDDGGRAAWVVEGPRQREGRSLSLALDPPVATGERRALTFAYEGIALDPGRSEPDWMGVLLVRPDEIRMSHQAQWMPIVPLDARARARAAAPTRLELELPAGMASLGPGRLVSVEPAGEGRERHVWEAERPVRASIVAGAYEVVEATRGPLAVRVLARPERIAGARAWGEEALAMLEVLSERLGGPEAGGYGIASMTIRNRSNSYNYEADGFSVYDEVLFDGREPDARKVAHEVAHRWFGGLVDPAGPGERFLTESLAEVAAWIAIETRFGAEAAREAVRESVRRYGTPDGAEHALARTTFGSPRYGSVVYAKGPVVLWTLRSWVGEERFRSGLRAYVARYGREETPPSLPDFLDAMRSKAGDVVDVWAAESVMRPDVPRYAIELDARKRTARGRLVQEGALFHHPVEIELRLANGEAKRITVEPRGRTTKWSTRVE